MPISGPFNFNYGRIPIVIIFIAIQYFPSALAICTCVVYIVDHKNNYERMTAVRRSIKRNEVRLTNFTVEMTVEVTRVSRYRTIYRIIKYYYIYYM
jgi:hypothetical protein